MYLSGDHENQANIYLFVYIQYVPVLPLQSVSLIGYEGTVEPKLCKKTFCKQNMFLFVFFVISKQISILYIFIIHSLTFLPVHESLWVCCISTALY